MRRAGVEPACLSALEPKGPERSAFDAGFRDEDDDRGHATDGTTADAGDTAQRFGDVDRDGVARALGLARAVEALLAAGLAHQARPLHAQLLGLLEQLAGDGGAVVSFAAERTRRGSR